MRTTVTYLGLSHLALVTNDMDATVRFYRDVLEMPLVGTLSTPARHYFFSIGPGAAIAFFEWPEAELPPRKESGVPASGTDPNGISLEFSFATRDLAAEPLFSDPDPVPAARQ
ncbi:MAG TPA: VOC family protein [Sporichthya sp.]|nr:VOC family protein [Sporichthya sp.]